RRNLRRHDRLGGEGEEEEVNEDRGSLTMVSLVPFSTLDAMSSLSAKERWARKISGKAKPAVRSEERLPPGQHLTSGFPVLDLGVRPEIDLATWHLEVGGLVEFPRTFTWEQFNALPQFENVSDFHCVTTWSKFDCRWSGVAFFTLAEFV